MVATGYLFIPNRFYLSVTSWFFILSKMKYNPLHPHCGPFNSIDKFPPKDKVDRACWQHDRGYAKLGPQAYIKYNKFDEQFVHRLSKT